MTNFKWDVPINQKIEFFDSDLSFEITKYRPITETQGLDFDPKWFQEASIAKETTGRYCNHPIGSRSYRKFWEEEMRRCKEGYEVNGYRLTGDHYFFLNYYVLLNVSKVTQAGAGRYKKSQYSFLDQYN